MFKLWLIKLSIEYMLGGHAYGKIGLIVLRVIDWILEHLGIKLREVNMKSRKR